VRINLKTRREFLRRATGYLMSIGFLSSPLLLAIRTVFAKARKVVLPRGTKRESLINQNPDELDPRNLEITPVEDFGTMGLDDHAVDLDAWRLEVNGHVSRSLSLSYAEITALPSIEKAALMICPGFFANYGQWKGISLKELLQRAGSKNGATHITIRGPKSANEKSERYPLIDILFDKVFLVYQVNGKPLPERHGFPVRVVAEGYYGYSWIKYVYNVKVEKGTG
jgi:DMSO/TMAO reductase YedYZ molybdopterin-dependent catalytic subunit